ncbi:hypothetical protein DdX_10019 [Ditylenchus destructor]|uniref:Uncharacterized protein n=1 Tax=Ditylenchus destructor TaxID=166010 RepID=A0AAD4N4Z5_9BILA|nr:hypothetical protein DdX_10019 [Ditylenchus destructor]
MDGDSKIQNNLSEPVIESVTVVKSAQNLLSDLDYLLPFETCLPENGIDFNESLELLYAHPGMTDNINDNFFEIEHAKDNACGYDTEEEHENRSARKDDCESCQ